MIPVQTIPPSELPVCAQCSSGQKLDFALRFAFQPIVDIGTCKTVAYEALVRGPNGEGAAEVLRRVTRDNLYLFDQTCRVEAVRGAARLGMRERLSINFLPNAVYNPSTCIRTTLAAAREAGFPVAQIIFEMTEGERAQDRPHLVRIIRAYQKLGFGTAIDDFGAGYAGLGLLSGYQPDILKLDMELVRGIDASAPRQAILKGVLAMCAAMDIEVLAEGIETAAERDYLADAGIRLMQGYLFSRPVLERLGEIDVRAWA
jgi:EAL domain-containing protein (putative c-di-GMP-specific phosphodiesterase class I)